MAGYKWVKEAGTRGAVAPGDSRGLVVERGRRTQREASGPGPGWRAQQGSLQDVWDLAAHVPLVILALRSKCPLGLRLLCNVLDFDTRCQALCEGSLRRVFQARGVCAVGPHGRSRICEVWGCSLRGEGPTRVQRGESGCLGHGPPAPVPGSFVLAAPPPPHSHCKPLLVWVTQVTLRISVLRRHSVG